MVTARSIWEFRGGLKNGINLFIECCLPAVQRLAYNTLRNRNCDSYLRKNFYQQNSISSSAATVQEEILKNEAVWEWSFILHVKFNISFPVNRTVIPRLLLRCTGGNSVCKMIEDTSE